MTTTANEAGAPAAAADGVAARRRLPKWLRVVLSIVLGLILAGLLAEALVLVCLGQQPKLSRRVGEAPWGLRYNDPAPAIATSPQT